MASKNSTIDITKTGPQGFRTLQDLNSLESPNIRPEIRDFITKSRSERNSYTLYNPYEQAPVDFETSFARTSTPWGSSRFDNKTVTEEEFRNLGDVRANNQPWYAKIGAGLAKGAILTGTTFLDGTVGLLVGAGTAMEEGRWSALWDNDFSKAMQAVNEKSEEWLPNYYTEKEQTSPWYENIFTANFLGDKFIKNLGFTVGAFYSGNVAANTIGLARRGLMAGAKGLGASINTVKNIGNVSSHVASAVGAVISAVNEGRIEALNNSKDWFELQKMQIDDRHNQMLAAIDAQYKGTEIYDSLVTAENNNYEATIGKLTEDRLKMGNADLLMNIPILTASNIIQFGKLYANGFKTAKRASNIVGRPGAYEATMTTSRGLIKGITNSLSEGVEEISQKAASVSSGLYHESDVNNFYKAKMDPETEQEQLDWMKALAKGINETVNEGSSWEEFFIGTLTGALGMPSFGRTNTKNAYIGKNKSIGLSGGIIGEVVEYRERMAREQEIVDYMNNRVQSPEFLNYYQGLTRHNKYQKDMNKAVLENDEFDYKNSEYNQFVSDIIMFDNAGKIEDLKTLIGSAYDTSDENLESIIKNTTSVTAEGKLVGPYAQYATRDSDGNIVANFGDEEGKREMANKLTESKNDMLKTIQDYIDAKTEIDLSVGDRIDDEQLKELTWLKIATQNLRDRGSEIFESAKMSLNKALGHATKRRDFFRRAKEAHANDSVEEGGKKRFNISEEYKRFEKYEKTEQSNIDFIADLLNSDPEIVGMYLAMNPKTLENIKEAVKNTPEISPTEAADFNKKIDDLIKIDKLSKAYNEKLEEYLKNPEKQLEDKAKAREEVAKSSKELSQSAIVSRFNWNASIPEIARTLEENRADIDSTGGIEEFRKLLTPAQKRKITQANKFNSTVKGLKNRIDGSDLTDQQKRIANSLIDQAASESENIKDIANSISNNLDSNVEEAIKRELSKPGMGVNGSDIEAIIEETAAKLKDFFDDIISKVAQSISEAERVREKKEKADAKKIKKAADDLSSKEKASGPSAEAAPQEEKKLDPTQDDAPKNERTINPTLPGDLTSRKFEPKKASNIEQGTGKNEYTFRPQISEVYMHGYNMQTYLQYIEETPEAIPEGVDPEAFKTYIREVHKYLKDKGAFAFVNGTDSTWKLEVGDKLSFEYDRELSDLAGVDVVTIVVEKDGKKQLVGTLPTSLDFDSKSRYSVTKEDGTVEWKTSNETTGEKRPTQKALYESVIRTQALGVTMSTEFNNGVSITTFTEYRRLKDGTIKEVTSGGKKFSFSKFSSVKTDTIFSEDENIEYFILSEIRTDGKSFVGEIRVKYKDSPGLTGYTIKFYEDPFKALDIRDSVIMPENFQTWRANYGTISSSFTSKLDNTKDIKEGNTTIKVYTGSIFDAHVLGAFQLANDAGIIEVDRELLRESRKDHTMSVVLTTSILRQLKNKGITSPKELVEYIENNYESPSKLYTTKVSSLRGGMISFSDTQKSVSDIYGDTVPIIAVMDTTPRLTTGNDAMDAKFIDANNAVPWQVYTMVPANNGSYLPALCISTPLEGLGKDDWYMQQMVEAFKNILTSTTDRKDRILEFYKWLNIPGLSVGIGTYEGHNKFVKKDITEATHVRITYSDPVNKDDVRQISINITRESLSDDAVFTALQNVISDYNQRAKKAGIHEITTNVDIKKLTNRPDHLEYRRNIAKYLSTNISEGPHTVNDWFTYEPTLIETEVVRAENAKKEEPGAAKPHIHNAAKVVTLNGVQYTKDEDGRIFNEKGEEVTIQLGEDILAEIGNSGRVEVTPPSQPELPKSAIDISAFGFTKPNISAAPTGRGSRRRPTRPGKNMDITEALEAEPKATKSSIEDDVRMIQKLFPSLSESGRVIVVNGLRVISEKGNAVEIYGHFRDGILYINSNSPRGTAFHEAFHYITEALMSESELGVMFNEAANRYGRMANIALEERLAEDFRDFINGFNDTSIMGRLKSMFRNLKYIIKQITGNINYLDNLFFNIYKGNYSNRREVLTDDYAVNLLRYKNNKLAYEYLSEDIQTGLAARGISKEDYNNLTVHDKENTIHCLI